MRPYPRRLLLLTACWIAIVSWISVALFVLGVVAYNLGIKISLFVETGEYILSLAILSMVFYLALLPWLRCPDCGKLILVNMGEAREPIGLKGLSASGAVVVNAISKGNFRCMHCGRGYSARPAPRSSNLNKQ